jgi:hypothetical protein
LANLAKMAKTKRRNNKVRRTKSRRGGGPFTIHGKKYDRNDPVPFKYSYWIPHRDGTAANHRFQTDPNWAPPRHYSFNPFKIFSSGVKPQKTDLQRLAKRLATQFDAEKDIIERNVTLNPYQKFLKIDKLRKAMEDSLNESAAREHDARISASRFPTFRNSVASVSKRLSRVASNISSKVDDFLFPETERKYTDFNNYRYMRKLMVGISPEMFQDIDWPNVKSMTKHTNGSVSVEMENPDHGYVIVTDEHKRANQKWYPEQ